MTVNLKGLYTPPPPEDRNIAYLDIEYNRNNYDWIVYVPLGVNIGEYLASIEQKIYSDIDNKETAWAALTSKTKTEIDPITNKTITINIQKTEIVKPDYPDYYAKRRAEYPPVSDQIGAIINPNASPSLVEIQTQIDAIKAKYPKPV